MDKDRKMFLGIILLLLFFMVFVGTRAFKDKKEENPKNSDALIFKKEYESLNNVVREKDGKTIKEIAISQNNPVEIVTEEKAISLLESGTGILYFGFPDCPWCRSMLPILLSTLDNMSISKLYYLNVANIRDTLALNEKGKPEVKVEGTKGYKRILELLDEELSPYYLTNDEGKQVDTKEKRLYAPTVAGFKDGKVVAFHEGTVESQKSGYDDLTEEEKKELSTIFENLINQVYDTNCDEAC